MTNELYELNNYTFNEKVKWLRHNKTKDNSKKGYWTSEKLADELDLSSSTIYNLENGKDCKLSTVSAIADYFGVSIDWLCSRSTVQNVSYDLKFTCDYTGLKEKTIQFFKDNKNIDGFKDTVDLIEILVDRLSYDIDYNFSLTDLRENTSSLSLTCNYDDKDKIVDIENRIELIKGIDESINGKKYKLSQFFNEVLDDYSISNTGLSSIIDLRTEMQKLYLHKIELLNNLDLKTYKEIYKDDIMRDISNTLLEQKESENNEEE